jgi:hypothetical protein
VPVEKLDVLQDSVTLSKVRKLIDLGKIEMFHDRGQFKHLEVKQFLDQFMPRAGGKHQVFRTMRDLEVEVVQRINMIHFDQAVIPDPSRPKYHLAFTTNYCHLKCSSCSSGK